ncbi:TPA: sigma 54 modulation/S30EA ribosomal C-terminal domain-containing protein, partial [Clostridioides difficile]|nr:sigma 54 modulation/S30EA ribosomal C-terminal domain-containing protein [Clostridioides difficile]
VKYKTKVKDKVQNNKSIRFENLDFIDNSSEFDDYDYDDEEDENIVIERRKKFNVKPMSSEEAILQMELVGHNFYMFRNQDNFEINIVYKRKAGGYGLIEQD